MKTKARKIAPPSCEQLRCRGAWRRLSLTLLVALCCHTAASAETLTVYDGTNDSQYLPVYGYYADMSDTKSEFVIPKGQLGDMEEGTISKLKFYLKTSLTAAWTAKFQVYLKEIDATTLTDIVGPDASTVVYTGTLDATGTEMTVTFDTPYTYNGGNLLIGTNVSEKSSNCNKAYFYGVDQNENTGCYRGTLSKFIPKTTFTYTPSSCVVSKPKNLAASNITHEKATITWISDESAWDIAWSTDPDFNPASATTRADNVSEKTYTITGLSQLTDYYVAVQNAGSGKWSSTLHFKTAAIATAVGNSWSENFESPGGWDLINGELTNQWTWGTAANNGGTHALYISNDGGTTNAYTFITSNTIVYATRLLTFTEGTFEFSYDWKANGESNSDYLRVALKPATESLTAGTTAPTGLNATSLPTGWIALDGGSQLSGVTAWQHKDATIDVAAGDYYLVFAWRNDGGAGNNPPAAIDNVSISKYTDKVTDLAVSNITTTAATISWNGNGDSYNVRYTKLFLTEGFEGGSMPAGWTKEGTGLFSIGTGDNETERGSHSGNKNARFPSSSSNIGNQTYLITPSMDLSGETSVKLSFWYINRAAVSHIDGIGVYYRVGNNGTWTALWSTTEAHGSWTNQEITLTGLAADYQLGFKMTNNDGYGVGLDDIQITPADWQTVNNITTKSTTLTGLDANTTYGCQVQNVKAGKTSLWSPIATFTTDGNCGTTGSESSVTWSYNPTTKTLTISGTGQMMYYGSAKGSDNKYHSTAPWSHFDSEIETVIVEDGVTYIGSYAFAYCTALTSVSLPATVSQMGNYVCYNSNLFRIDIPNATGVVSLGTGGFDDTPSGLVIAVPANLLKTYKGTTNWSGYAAKLEGVLSETTGFDTNFATGNYEYKRTFNCGVAATLCLPFELSSAQISPYGKVYTFDGVDKTTTPTWTVVMQETDPSNLVSGNLAANTPYLFVPYILAGKSKGDAMPLIFTGEVATAANAGYTSKAEGTAGAYWTFQGVYYNVAWNDGNANLGKVYGFAARDYTNVNPGDFVKAAAGASIAPFRAFLQFTAGGSSAPRRGAAEEALPSRMTVRLVNADGDVTAIGTIDTKTGEIRFDNDAWYTLDGRRLNSTPGTRGIYIKNGKKIILK